MDFWQRLIAGTSLSPVTNKTTAATTYSNPEKRLQRFKRGYSQLLVSDTNIPNNWAGHAEAFQQIWRTTTDISKHNDVAENVRACIQDLTALLSDEARRPLPHVCIAFAASKQIYLPIAKLATTSYNELIIREAVTFFGTLIESEEEDFLENEAFSKSLMTLLVRITGANGIHLGSDAEVEVVELAFEIAAKIRLQPEILPAWFTEVHKGEQEGKSAHVNQHDKFTGKTHKADFPLFYLLIDYIHHEGRVGDFARTGLLYIIESAATSESLEQWIVESDLGTLMATGLGALYSQLSRKLVIDYPSDQVPAILRLSDYEQPMGTSEIVSSSSAEFQGHMETFLSHLMFWQDVLEHCKSLEVKQTLLEHFQVIFLQQLLYPSMLESSDIDGEISGGGSSVAVLTYLGRILEDLHHPDLIHMILQYLLALPVVKSKSPVLRAKVSAALQRKSRDLQSMLAAQSTAASNPAIYNLVDLVLGTLSSKNQQTISASLQLLSTMLRKHHKYTVTTLLQISNAAASADNKTITMHEFELELLTGFIDHVGIDEGIADAYEVHVKDITALLEFHPCSQELIQPRTTDGVPKSPHVATSIPGVPQAVTLHRLRPDDAVLKSLVSLLENFFTNPVEVNLSLTETIVDIATCGFLQISGWLLPEATDYEIDEASIVTTDTFNTITSKRPVQHVTCPLNKLPPLLSTLRQLAHQTSLYRAQIPRFDDLLLQRRADLSDSPVPKATSSEHQKSDTLTRDISPAASSARPTPKANSTSDSLAFRMFPGFRQRSRSPSNHSVQDVSESQPATPTPASRTLGGLVAGISEVIRPGLTPTRSQKSNLDVDSMVTESVGVEESQARAFREIERAILSRRVTIPKDESVPMPSLAKSTEAELDPDDGEARAEALARQAAAAENEVNVSVSHVLTNVLVFHEFLLEIVALVQVRASLFGGIVYD